MKKKEVRRWCTGMTKEELMKEMKALEKGTNHVEKCYLCKRPENDTAVLLTPDEKEPYALTKITLIPVHREIAGGHTFIYFLCWECALLVGLRAKPVGQKEVTLKEKQSPTQFLPAGPAPDFYS
jgi:hypothetical protein